MIVGWFSSHEDLIGGCLTLAAGLFAGVFSEKLAKRTWFARTVVGVTLVGGGLTLYSSLDASRSQAANQKLLAEKEQQILDNATAINNRVQDASQKLGTFSTALSNEKDAVTHLTDNVNEGTKKVLSATKQVSGQLQQASRTSLSQPDRFTINIPIQKSIGGYSIPSDGNMNDRMSPAYAMMDGIAEAPTDSRAISPFLAKVLQYYVLQLVFNAENPLRTFDASPEGGFAVHSPPPVAVPEAQEFTADDWMALTNTLDLEYNSVIPRTTWLPKILQIPSQTRVSFANSPRNGEKQSSYSVILQRTPDYSLAFLIEPAGAAVGILPPHFVPAPPIGFPREFSTYSFTVTMLFTWNGDRDRGRDYEKWATGIMTAVKGHLAAD